MRPNVAENDLGLGSALNTHRVTMEPERARTDKKHIVKRQQRARCDTQPHGDASKEEDTGSGQLRRGSAATGASFPGLDTVAWGALCPERACQLLSIRRSGLPVR